MLKSFFGKITKKSHKEHSRHAELDGKSPSSSRKSNLQKFEADKMRLLVIRDTEQGIKKLFDSQTQYDGTKCNVLKVPLNCRQSDDSGLSSSRSLSFSGCSTLSGSYTSGRVRSNSDRISNVTSDVFALAEMMFGNVSMKIVGDSVKVHYIRSTNEFLLSKVFVHKPHSSTASCSLTDPSEASPSPSPLSSSADHSIPRNCSSSSFTGDISKPSSILMIPRARPPSQLSNESGASGSCGGGSKSNSYQRRLEHSWYTSFQNEHGLYYHVKKPLLEGSTKSTGCSQSGRKHRKIAIGLIFSLNEKQFSQFEQFFFSHFALIYSHLEELRLSVDDNLHMLNFKKADWIEFHTGTRKAFDEFSEDFLALYNSPRVEDPVWLTLVKRPDLRKSLCTTFMGEFVSAINKLDTKETKFFMSTLLTAVLTHHCAWIYTVSADTPDRQEEYRHKPKALDLLSKTHPYNSLWAQLGDLYGAITHPMTVTRTVVTGKTSNVNLIECLLFLLTYFIRCFDIEDISEVEPVELGSRCSSVISDHMTPKSEQHFNDFPCSLKSSREVLSGGGTPVKRKPNPFSFASIKSSISRSRNVSQSDRESFELSSKSLCSSSAGSLLAFPSSKTKEQHTAQSWQRQKSLNDSNHFSSEGDLTSCSAKALVSGHSNELPSCDNSDSLSLHTHVPDSPLFKRRASELRDDNTAESSLQLVNLTCDGNQCMGSGVRFNMCQEYLQSCEVCSRASTPELQCSDECLSNQTCRLLFQTSSQCFIPRDACYMCEKQYTCSFSHKPKPAKTSKPSKPAKREPRCSLAVCENPLYVTFDPNCSYSSHQQKYITPDKPQVCTRLPLIWPQNSWEEMLTEEDPFDDNCQTTNNTTQDDSKQRDDSESVWPYNSESGFFQSSTTDKKESDRDLVFPQNTEYKVKQDTSYSYGVNNSSPVSKDSGNCSFTTSRLDNMSVATNEESSGIGGGGAGLGFSVEESLLPSMIKLRQVEDGTNKRSSLLAEQLQEYELAKEGGYLGLQDYVNFDEVDLSTCYDLQTFDKSSDTYCKQLNGFGRSLMASVSDTYLPDFVLHGTTQKDFTEKLYEDLKAVVKCSVVDDPVDYAQAIVADTSDWSVKIRSVTRPQDVWVPDYMEQCRPATTSSSVRSMLEAIQVLWKMNMSAEFCMLHLEDRLQALNETGMLLGSCLVEHAEGHLPSNLAQLTKLFRVDISDLQLLLAVASAHSPDIGKILCATQSTHRR